MSDLEKDFDLQWEGRRCVVRPLAAKPAQAVARRLVNIVGAGIREAGLAGSVEAAELITAGAILERIDDATLTFLTDTFVAVTSIEASAGADKWMTPKEIPDLVFGGGAGLARWMRWLRFCIETSCGDFFAELRAMAPARKTPQASPSPTT